MEEKQRGRNWGKKGERKEGRKKGRKKAVEMNVVHCGLYEINK